MKLKPQLAHFITFINIIIMGIQLAWLRQK